MGAQKFLTIRLWAACALSICTAQILGACTSAGTIISGDNTNDSSTGSNSADLDSYLQGTHPAQAQIQSRGGRVLQAPVLQAVSFDSDANTALYEAFVQALPHSAYWSTTTAEYGVGAAAAAEPLRMAFPADINLRDGLTDGSVIAGEKSDIESFLIAQLDGQNPSMGAPSANTLYILFMPAGVAISPDAQSPQSACADGVLAWHTAMLLPSSQVTITYVVVPDCGPQAGLSAIDSRTMAASHVIIEAVTDPHMDAFANFDAEHGAWLVPAGGTEVGAACIAALSGDANIFVYPADLGFVVQRTWSNAQAALGHAPCVPANAPATTPYFDALPVLPQSVTLPLGANLVDPNLTLSGIPLPPKTTATIVLQLFSDGKTSGPWSVSATEVGTSSLTLSTDKAQGNNGDSLNLTLVAGTEAAGYSLVRLTSSLGQERHNQYIIVTH